MKDEKAKDQDAFRSFPLPRRRRPWRRERGWLAVETSGGRERKNKGKKEEAEVVSLARVFVAVNNSKCHFVNPQGHFC